MSTQNIKMDLVSIERPDDFQINLILGTAHFIKTVEDIYEAIMNVNPAAKFGLAFCEASGPRKIRTVGTDKQMVKLALKNAQKIGAGHSFVLFLNKTFPINIMHSLRTVPEILNILCATANPVQVIVAQTKQGRAILGIVDGGSPLAIADKKDEKDAHDFLQKTGYKLTLSK